MLTHIFRKPYPCSKCNRSYTNKSTLNRHLREECGKLPQYMCRYCHKAFHQRSNFQRHVWTDGGSAMRENVAAQSAPTSVTPAARSTRGGRLISGTCARSAAKSRRPRAGTVESSIAGVTLSTNT
ncbi:PREDICTED: zinc finger protein 354C-like isoform X2 [Dinoponera quadriceps]|nr:PREDICTED: zinc finger protein 354C-like isoform X2 [Dinoponera quadriceps]